MPDYIKREAVIELTGEYHQRLVSYPQILSIPAADMPTYEEEEGET